MRLVTVRASRVSTSVTSVISSPIEDMTIGVAFQLEGHLIFFRSKGEKRVVHTLPIEPYTPARRSDTTAKRGIIV